MTLKLYIASRTRHAQRWREARSSLLARGVDILSSWIDHDPAISLDEPEGIEGHARFWRQIGEEIGRCDELLLYVQPEDFPLKGALVECGMALALNKPVMVVCEGVTIERETYRPLGSWLAHPRVQVVNKPIGAVFNELSAWRADLMAHSIL